MSKPTKQANVGGMMSSMEGRNTDDSSRSDPVLLSKVNKNASRLPSAVASRIAEFLISQFAFGTAASVNRTSKAIYTETLPVLYETFFYDDWMALSANRRSSAVLPEAVKNYSKYIFYTTPGEDVKEFDRLKECRGVVMTICADVNNKIKNSDLAHVRLYKPVSSVTAFSILETPFRHDGKGSNPWDHEGCILAVMKMAMVVGVDNMGGDSGEAGLPMAQDCDAVGDWPTIRPVSSIRHIVLVKDSYLHGNRPTRLASVKTNVRLHDSEIQVNGKGVPYDNIIATYMQLVRLAAMQRNPKEHIAAQKRLVPSHGAEIGMKLGMPDARYVSAPCTLRLGYTEWHLNLVLTLRETYSFFQKLKVEAESRPSVLLNRLRVRICNDSMGDKMEFGDMTALVKTIREIYSVHITGAHHILPTRSDPPELVRCVAMTEMPHSPELAKQIAGALNSMHVVVPMVATQLSGSIKAIPKKRGVKIVAEIAKRQQFLDGPPQAIEPLI